MNTLTYPTPKATIQVVAQAVLLLELAERSGDEKTTSSLRQQALSLLWPIAVEEEE